MNFRLGGLAARGRCRPSRMAQSFLSNFQNDCSGFTREWPLWTWEWLDNRFYRAPAVIKRLGYHHYHRECLIGWNGISAAAANRAAEIKRRFTTHFVIETRGSSSLRSSLCSAIVYIVHGDGMRKMLWANSENSQIANNRFK